MFGKRKSAAHDVGREQRLEAMRASFHAEVDYVEKVMKENDRLRKTIGKVKRCPDRQGDNRKACEWCGLVQHALDTSKHEPCRRCLAGVEPGEFFVDIPASKIRYKMDGRDPKVFTVCSSCYGVQPWKRVQCHRCRRKVKTYGRTFEGKVEIDEALGKLSRGNKILRASLERKEDMFGGLERQLHEQNKYLNKKIKELERRLEERRTSQRDTDARIRAEARSLGVDTFMGFSIADHVEAMDVAEELARSVRKYGSQSHAGEIASRFLKLRTPPAPKKVVTRLHCPKCEALAGEEGSHGKITHYFCPNYKCGWRCEA